MNKPTEELLREAMACRATSVAAPAGGEQRLAVRMSRHTHTRRYAIVAATAAVIAVVISTATLLDAHKTALIPAPGVGASPTPEANPTPSAAPSPTTYGRVPLGEGGPAHFLGVRKGHAAIYDSRTGALVVDDLHLDHVTAAAAIPGTPSYVLALLIAPCRSQLFVAYDSTIVPGIQQPQGDALQYPEYGGIIRNLAVSPDGHVAFSVATQKDTTGACTENDELRVITRAGVEVGTWSEPSGDPTDPHYLYGLSWSPDNRHLTLVAVGCCGGGDRGYSLFDTHDARSYVQQDSKALNIRRTDTSAGCLDRGARWLKSGALLVEFGCANPNDPRSGGDAYALVDPATGNRGKNVLQLPNDGSLPLRAVIDSDSTGHYLLLDAGHADREHPYLARNDNGNFYQIANAPFDIAIWAANA